MNTLELQWHLIYSAVVAGKSAEFADGVMHRLFNSEDGPFDQICVWGANGHIERVLREARTGNYKKLTRCLSELVLTRGLDLATCTPAELELIHGIGPKTSRFFILWTRPDAVYAALDVHILRWLSGLGHKVPKATPQSTARYAQIEKWFLEEARIRGVTARTLDHAVWVEGAGHDECTYETAQLVKPQR